ncbi:hypothetical protein AAC387_Pa01g1369 [Persea americana]
MADAVETRNGETIHDVQSLLSFEGRDFLVRNNGDQVNTADLAGKIIGLYFSASWCGPCQGFTPIFAEAYTELYAQGNFEAVFVSADKNEETFKEYFAKMPWLAIPFSDSTTRDRLNELFEVNGIPHLVLLGGNGKVLSDDGVERIREYGEEAYPFLPEKLKQIKEEEEAARRNQSLSTLLVTQSRDFFISNDGNKVLVSEIQGKMVALYFCFSSHNCREFTTNLVEMYKELKDKEEKFEVVLIFLDDDEQSYVEILQSIPFLAVPFKDKVCEKLARYFELSMLPTLVIIGSDGKTVNSNVAEHVEVHGIQAYPFTPEKLEELEEIERKWLESQTLESLLVSGERDFVIGKGGVKVPVSELVGKHILLYFSAHWCPPWFSYTPKLTEVYHEIKAKDPAFELIFISSDRDQNSFDDYFSSMPWLALPFGDERKKFISRTLKIFRIPSLVAIGPTGKTITTEACDLVTVHGSDAYPFTEEHLKLMEAKIEEMAKRWPEKVKHDLHTEHELNLERQRVYYCDGCGDKGRGWSYYCKKCNFDLHPKCALEEEKKEDDEKGENKDGHGHEAAAKEGWLWRLISIKLTEVYHEIKAKDPAFELIFISSDRDQKSFDDYFSSMPWLVLPFGDERKKFISRTLKIFRIPSLVAIGPTGKTITTEACDLVTVHGSDAYPFTEEHLKLMEAKIEEMAKRQPEKVKHDLHTEHELNLERQRVYYCDGCGDEGRGLVLLLSYFCKECNFDLHPKCALEEEKKEDDEKGENKDGHGHEAAATEGWVCDGDVCKKARSATVNGEEDCSSVLGCGAEDKQEKSGLVEEEEKLKGFGLANLIWSCRRQSRTNSAHRYRLFGSNPRWAAYHSEKRQRPTEKVVRKNIFAIAAQRWTLLSSEENATPGPPDVPQTMS